MDGTKESSRSVSQSSGAEAVAFKIQSKPSAVIKSHQRTITIDGKAYELILVTMKRSFLLVVKDAACISSSLGLPPPLLNVDGAEADMSGEALIRSFMNVNSPLQGLSLAIGEHSTCLIPSDNSLASTSLATRLSRKLNLNRPVYVASDVKPSTNSLDMTDFMSKLYLKIFQFVNANYPVCAGDDVEIHSEDRTQK